MRWLDTIRLRLRSLFGRTRANEELDAEIRFYLDQEVRKHVANGASPAEARRQALLAFGSLDAVKDDCRAAWGFRAVENLARDVRHGLRGLRRAPGFTAMVLVTLGVGIGATTLMFVVAWALWLRPLPYAAAERLVAIQELRADGPTGVRHPTIHAWRERAAGLDGIVAIEQSPRGANLAGRGAPERVVTVGVSPGFFALLSTESFAAGRDFVASDADRGAEAVAVLNHGFWMRRFGGDDAVVGEVLRLDGQPVVVAGVAPAGFHFPGGDRVDVYRPLELPSLPSGEGRQFFLVLLRVIGRLAPGVPADRAAAELEVIRAQFSESLFTDPEMSRAAASRLTDSELQVQSLHEQMVGDVRGRVWLLSGVIVLLMLIACANVANLQVIRTLGREREMAVRLTMGATRRRVAAQLLTETLVLGGLATVAAVLALASGMGGLRALVSGAALLADTIGLDGAALGFAGGMAVLICLVSVGAALVWLPRFVEGVTIGPRTGASAPRRRLRSALLGVQVSLTLLLLVNAGLLLTSLARLTTTDLGFDRRYLMTFRAEPPMQDPAEVAFDEQLVGRAAFAEQVVQRIAALPGVESVAVTNREPLRTNEVIPRRVGLTGREVPRDEQPLVLIDTISPGYIATMGMRLEAGRDFTRLDGPDAPPVVIANRQFVRRFFPGERDARVLDRPLLEIARRFRPEGMSIVGIVADAQTLGIADEIAPQLYWPSTQNPVFQPAFLVRAGVDPITLVSAIRAEVQAVDPDLPLFDIATVDDRVAQSAGPERMSSVLVGSFAVLALLLAAVGVYSVAGHVAAQRRYELGVRLALGATARQLLVLVVGQALRPVFAGALLGIAAALASGGLFGSFLFEVGPADPGAYGAATVLLLGVALLATCVPARRASQADPVVTLKTE